MLTTPRCHFFCFFFNDTATTEIYTLSLHDALPICTQMVQRRGKHAIDRNLHLVPLRSEGPKRLGDDRVALLPRAQSAHHRRSEEHTSELQSQSNLVCRLLLEKKKTKPRSP